MKKIIGLSFIAVLLTLQSCGTTSNMQEFYTKYDNQSTVIPLPSFALKLAGKAGGTDLFNYLKSAKVLAHYENKGIKYTRIGYLKFK